ncbi:MAG: retropepsin-like aspartic protease [Myxococcota bacterium]
MLAWLLACAFHVPAPAGGEPADLPLAAHPEDTARPYATWDGRLWFVDTGASRTTCDDDLVAALGLPVRETAARSRGAVGTVRLGRVVLRDVEIGGWRFRRLPCAVRDLDTTSSVPGDVAGILGANLFRHFTVAIDFRGGRARLLRERVEGGARLARERLVGPRLVARMTVEGERVRAIIDTGADRTYLPLEVGEEVLRYEGVRQGTGPGGSRKVEVVVRRVRDARVGEVAVPLEGYLAWDGDVGLLGMDVLGEGVVAVDFPGRRLVVGE